ncbi:MAG: adenine deaminase [bacterium]|nr:adenine deaminase [bacterium]
MKTLEGNIIDLHNRRIFPGRVRIVGGIVIAIIEDDTVDTSKTILPGFVDAHVHVESSMLLPSEFARLAVVHGTVATVSDPHEIGNVCGVEGVRYMIDNGSKVPFTFAFGAPSCVPATPYETAGAVITAADIRTLFEDSRVRYLSEMMNWPGVLHNDAMILEKLAVAKDCGRVIDGHAPGLKGEDAKRYVAHGISTDHECFTLQEALDKVNAGMKILIREGSAARNFEALHPMLALHPDVCMLCSDDMHPDSLVVGHINLLVKRALAYGHDLYDVLRAACVHPVEHYGLPVGQLRVGDPADMIVIDNINDFNVLQTYVRGELVAENGTTLVSSVNQSIINKFSIDAIEQSVLNLTGGRPRIVIDEGKPYTLSDSSTANVRVIDALDGQLITTESRSTLQCVDGAIVADVSQDVLKIVVINRYAPATPSIAFIRNFGLKNGAIASSVAHDSHNVVAVGTNDADLCNAINAVISARGGVSVSADGTTDVLALPVAGLMSNDDGYAIAEQYSKLDARAKQLGSPLRAPFMTLSFMALLVIPQLKISDKGLFDGSSFKFTSLIVE